MTNFFVRHNWIFLAAVFVLVWFFTGHKTMSTQVWLAYSAAVTVSLFTFSVLGDIEKAKKIARRITRVFKDNSEVKIEHP